MLKYQMRAKKICTLYYKDRHNILSYMDLLYRNHRIVLVVYRLFFCHGQDNRDL